MKRITRGVIPAAGKGTRMRSLASSLPKELLPVGGRPTIDFALEEAAASGLRELAVVINSGKEAIRRHLEQNREGSTGRPLRFHWVYQEEARGLADAIDRCREWLRGEPFALLLPDNVILSVRSGLRSLLSVYQQGRSHRRGGRDVVGVIEVDAAGAPLYGNAGRIDVRPLEEDTLFEIDRMHDKRPGRLSLSQSERVHRSCGRYVCHPDLFQFLDRVRPLVRGEFDEVPIYQEIIRRRGALGVLIPPPLFDTGNPRGYAAAQAYLAGTGGG